MSAFFLWIFPTIVCAIINLLLCIRSSHPIRLFLEMVLSGIFLLFLFHWGLGLLGMVLQVNVYSMIAAAILGLPGIVCILLFNVLL